MTADPTLRQPLQATHRGTRVPAVGGRASAKLQLSPLYDVHVVPGEGAYLLSERGQFLLAGSLNLELLELLDGSRDEDAIVDRLMASGEFTPAEVYYRLHMLRQNGFVDSMEPGVAIDPPVRAFWRGLGIEPYSAESRRRNGAVRLSGCSHVSVDGIARVLQDNDVDIRDDATLGVVVVDDYLCDDLRDLNAAALAAQRPWLLAKPTGTVVWVGPVFAGDGRPCWACLAQRLRLNRDVDNYAAGQSGRRQQAMSLASFPTASGLAGSLMAFEVARTLAVPDPSADARASLLTLDLADMATRRHVVVARPQCPACGQPDDSASLCRPVRLQPRGKRFTADGGHRTALPEETVESHIHHVSPYTGAVKELVREDGIDGFMHNYSAGRNPAVRSTSLHNLQQTLRSLSAGKGATDAQAKASALCEALERYSGLFHGDERRVHSSFARLGDRAVHPNDCMLFSQRQYQTRDEWNARRLRFHTVPRPLDPDAAIDWTPVWSLTRDEARFLPTSYLFYSYPHNPETFFCAADSNGNAAGNTVEEAVLQGFLELVERDCVAQWWYNRFQVPELDLDSFDDPYVHLMRRTYADLERPLWVLDVTNDLGIPAFVAVSRRVDKPVEDILLAFGAHLDPALALRRAVTELNQFLPAVHPMKADGTGDYAFPDAESQSWWRTATVAAHPYLLPAAGGPTRRPADFPVIASDDIRDDVEFCRSLVERRGMEMLVLDQTRPDIGLPVVKVQVPGMRHFWARFAAGRLYDVPVATGRLPRPLPEEELNPIPLFL